MKQRVGIDFIHGTLRTTGIVLLIFFPFCLYYLGPFPAMAFFSGGVWGMINLIFLTSLVRAVLHPGRIPRLRVAVLMLVKFPLLYVSGYFLLIVPQFEPLHLLIGFSILLMVILLKSVAIVLLRSDSGNTGSEHLPGMS